MAAVDVRFRLLMKLGRLLCPHYRFKWPKMDWLQDARFNAYLENFGEADGMARSEARVQKALATLKRVAIYKGWILGRCLDDADGRFTFVHIDVDLYAPTLDSLRFFHERMRHGGIVAA